MNDYTYPSVYLAYLFFLIVSCGALFFFFRTIKDGYWGKESEEAKYQMLEEGNSGGEYGRTKRK